VNSSAPRQVTGLSYGGGLVLDPFQRTQLGIVVGWDMVSGGDSNLWPYQNRPWISIAINYSFLVPTGQAREDVSTRGEAESSHSAGPPPER